MLEMFTCHLDFRKSFFWHPTDSMLLRNEDTSYCLLFLFLYSYVFLWRLIAEWFSLLLLLLFLRCFFILYFSTSSCNLLHLSLTWKLFLIHKVHQTACGILVEEVGRYWVGPEFFEHTGNVIAYKVNLIRNVVI